MPLNFGGRKRSGAFDTVWPSAKANIVGCLAVRAGLLKGEKVAPGAGIAAAAAGSRPRAWPWQPRRQACVQPPCGGQRSHVSGGLWPNGQGVGPRNQRLQVRVLPGSRPRRPYRSAARAGLALRPPAATGWSLASGHTEDIKWPRGVTVSTLDSESSDRGSNPREAYSSGDYSARLCGEETCAPAVPSKNPQNPL